VRPAHPAIFAGRVPYVKLLSFYDYKLAKKIGKKEMRQNVKSKTILFLFVLITIFSMQFTHSAISVDFIDSQIKQKPSTTEFERKSSSGLLWESFIQTFGFGAILHVYIQFEQSGFTVVNSNLMSDTYFVARNYNSARHMDLWSESTRLRWEENPPSIMYVFFDINGNGTPDLLIGGTWAFSGTTSLIAIYTLQNGVPVPFEYERCMYVVLDLFEDIYGNYNIVVTRFGRAGIWHRLFTIDENNNFLETSNLSSWERNTLCGCCYLNLLEFTEFFYTGSYELITEDEYNTFLMQYGIYNNNGRVEYEWKRLIPRD